MKQGRASNSSDGAHKREPISHSVNVHAVSEIGQQVVRHSSINLYEGRGIEAPVGSTDIHHCGSQGKHK